MPPRVDELDRVAKAEADGKITAATAGRIRQWLTETPFLPYLDALRAEIQAERWTELDNAFYAVLEFGTGGRRGRMYPVGTNVLNDRTMAESARGLADYVTSIKGETAERSCVIAYDTRHNSRRFAEICAGVLIAAGFKVHLFDEPRSTPLLSTAVRKLECDAGIMITASHNPPSDNGFKCYSSTGGQVIPPDDAGIIACVQAASEREIPLGDLKAAQASGLLVIEDHSVDEYYLDSVVSQSVAFDRDIKIVYTPLHGVGEGSVAAALQRGGFDQVTVLASQRTPDGDFPTVPGHVSNPEIPKTLDAAIEEARAQKADLVIASDPDADRIGIAVPVTGDPDGDWTTLDGNQIGALLTAFVIKETAAAGKLRPDHYVVTTLVTSQMSGALAEREGVRVEDNLLVGFKWIAKRIDECGPAGFLFGFEESHGYAKGNYARDKDAAVASFLFAELTATVKSRKQTVLEYLDSLYIDVGHYGEKLMNIYLEGRSGAEQIAFLMNSFRQVPPLSVGGLEVARVYDYKTHEIRRPEGPIELLPKPSGDMLIFELAEPGCRFAARPSGTEPKIKFYIFARTPVDQPTDLAAAKVKTAERLAAIQADLDAYIKAALVEAGI